MPETLSFFGFFFAKFDSQFIFSGKKNYLKMFQNLMLNYFHLNIDTSKEDHGCNTVLQVCVRSHPVIWTLYSALP